MTINFSNPLLAQLGIQLPLVQGPMNGASTPAMAAAVSNAGGLGSLAVSLLAPAVIESSVAALRQQTERPFNVNLFVLDPPQPNEDEVQHAAALLAPIRAELGLPPAAPLSKYGENFRDQLEMLISLAVPVASFTFGLLDATSIERLHAAGSLVIGTATNVAEALAWAHNGADVICAQGGEAGGHRGTFIGPFEDSMIGTLALVPQIVDAVRLPVIAAGGVMDGRGVAASLMLGAQAAQLGSAFLACAEASIHPGWKALLRSADDTSTRTTRAFSGRPARGIANDYMRRMAAHEAELPAYPIQNALTAEIRQAAAKANRMEFISLWAGQAAGLSRTRAPGLGAAQLVAQLADETRAALSRFG